MLRTSDTLQERLIWAAALLSAALSRVSAAPVTRTVAILNSDIILKDLRLGPGTMKLRSHPQRA
eukprot:6186770-Pleurochrysis_carterae.AAC.6